MAKRGKSPLDRGFVAETRSIAESFFPVQTKLVDLTFKAGEKLAQRIQGSPYERASRAYGKGIEARIARRAKKARKP